MFKINICNLGKVNNLCINYGVYGLIDSVIRNFEGVYIAGGSLRSFFDRTPLEDYDVFFRDEESFTRTLNAFTTQGFEVVWKCPMGSLTTLKMKHALRTYKVQLITERFYPSMEALLDSFDFTVTRFGYDGSHIYFDRQAYRDARSKTLRIHHLSYPIATLKRVEKYVKKGYKTTPDFYNDLLDDYVGSLGTWDENSMRLYID